jgi:hypothetical protein
MAVIALMDLPRLPSIILLPPRPPLPRHPLPQPPNLLLRRPLTLTLLLRQPLTPPPHPRLRLQIRQALMLVDCMFIIPLSSPPISHFLHSGTYFYQNGNAGACGNYHADTDWVVAMGQLLVPMSPEH